MHLEEQVQRQKLNETRQFGH